MKTPKFWYNKNSIYKIFLLPLTYLWILGSFLKKIFEKPIKFKVPIICVGNIIAGGGGKTPLTIQLAKVLIRKGYNTHIIKKQYKGSNNKNVLLVKKNSRASIVGDEPLLLANTTKTWLAKSRALGIDKAIKNGAKVIILDDGYQDYSIIKDYNILTIKESQEFGNKQIIPAGPLRESIEKGLEKADHIFYYGNKKSFNYSDVLENTPITEVKIKKVKKKDLYNIKNKNVLAFTGIAHPNNFFDSLISYGFNLVKKFEYPDHYKYSKVDIIKIISMSNLLKLSIITTEKDHVKIPKNLRKKIFSIPFEIVFNEREFFKNLKFKINLND